MGRKNKTSSGQTQAPEESGVGNGNGMHSRETGLISPEDIAARAYQIYEREGRVDGRDAEHWFQAESELRAERQQPQGSMQSGSQASQPTEPRSARQHREEMPDRTAGMPIGQS